MAIDLFSFTPEVCVPKSRSYLREEVDVVREKYSSWDGQSGGVWKRILVVDMMVEDP